MFLILSLVFHEKQTRLQLQPVILSSLHRNAPAVPSTRNPEAALGEYLFLFDQPGMPSACHEKADKRSMMGMTRKRPLLPSFATDL
ncbi:hypothetical protein [Leeia aquatica]|uniref:Uncharacterized protein n=1 Tax=Leeia aquatica TaxID=2725557 RepID=A0A847S4V9_9NEIS|nr:hypothetical protein [Leeia aquatica]NLR74844.1 hypothetical protein [Leeia aquatica]